MAFKQFLHERPVEMPQSQIPSAPIFLDKSEPQA